jgi:hypothetical protein
VAGGEVLPASAGGGSRRSSGRFIVPLTCRAGALSPAGNGAGWNPRPTSATVRRGMEPAPYKHRRPARGGTRALQAPPFGAGWNPRPTSATVRRGMEPAPYKHHRSARGGTRALQALPCGAGWNPRPTSATVRRGVEHPPHKRHRSARGGTRALQSGGGVPTRDGGWRRCWRR